MSQVVKRFAALIAAVVIFALGPSSAAGTSLERDARFGDDGRVVHTVPMMNHYSDVLDVFPLADGSFYLRLEVDHARILRFTSTGALDTTWGRGGEISYGDSGWIDVDSAGRIYFFDAVRHPGADVLDYTRVQRLRIDGTADPSWGVNGTATVNADEFVLPGPSQVGDQPSGGLVAEDGLVYVPFHLMDAGGQSGVFRLREGALDPSFGSGGGFAFPGQVADGEGSWRPERCVLAGISQVTITASCDAFDDHGRQRPVFFRRNHDGTPATGFANAGTYLGPIEPVIQGDQGPSLPLWFGEDRFGYARRSYGDHSLHRLLLSGQPDLAWAQGGVFEPRVNGAMGSASTRVQEDGTTLALVGTTLLRLDRNGQPDPDFGGTGRLEVPGIDGVDSAATNVFADGTIITAGMTNSGSGSVDYILTKFRGDASDVAVQQINRSVASDPVDVWRTRAVVSSSGPLESRSTVLKVRLPRGAHRIRTSRRCTTHRTRTVVAIRCSLGRLRPGQRMAVDIRFRSAVRRPTVATLVGGIRPDASMKNNRQLRRLLRR